MPTHQIQRVYDLTTGPAAHGSTGRPTREERDRLLGRARSRGLLGIRPAASRRGYTWMGISRSRPIVKKLTREGILIPITGRTGKWGKPAELIIQPATTWHCWNRPRMAARKAERTTFLSPFDNLLWANRGMSCSGVFHQSIEAYLPAPKRVYGYFALPILHKERLVGRVDPKLERKNRHFAIKSALPGARYQTNGRTDK